MTLELRETAPQITGGEVYERIEVEKVIGVENVDQHSYKHKESFLREQVELLISDKVPTIDVRQKLLTRANSFNLTTLTIFSSL